MRFDRLPRGAAITGSGGQATQTFALYWQRHCKALEEQIAGLAAVNARQDEIITDLAAVVEAQGQALEAIQAAQAAADAATSAAEAANTAAAEAQSAISTANETLEQIAEGTLELQALTVGGTRFVNNNGTLQADL